MATHRDHALPLRTWEYSETSQTAALFCRELGVVRGIAKGARRAKSPYSGGFELLTAGDVVTIERRSANALWLFTEWALTEVFWKPRRDLKSHRIALYMLDLTQASLSPLDPHPPLWDALLGALRALERDERGDTTLLNYQWAVLSEAGYRLRLDSYEPPGSTASAGLDVQTGSLVPDPGREGSPGVLRLRWETAECLRAVSEQSPTEERPERTIQRANRLLAAYARIVFDAELQAGTVLFGEM